MSSFGKRKNRKIKKTTNYTVADFVDDEVEKFGQKIEATMEAAENTGVYGVMIVGNEDVFISDLVPYRKVFRAGSMEAVERMRAIREGAEE